MEKLGFGTVLVPMLYPGGLRLFGEGRSESERKLWLQL